MSDHPLAKETEFQNLEGKTMKPNRALLVMAILAATFIPMAWAQQAPSLNDLHHQLQGYRTGGQLSGPQLIEQHIVDNKLKLSLQDAIQLMLLNNTSVRMNELNYHRAVFALQRSFSPFDTILTSSFSPARTTSPTSSTIAASSTLDQPFTVGVSQLFALGTTLNLNFSTDRNDNNSSVTILNPALSSTLNFSVSQPLLRGAGLAANRGQIWIARRNIQQSQANFEVQIGNSILSVISQYWSLVQAQKNLDVLQDSLRLAEESYKRDKRSLELGAIASIDIYRSEATVAQRRLSVLQAQYAVKPLEDQLRSSIGADLDPRTLAIDIELTEKVESTGELVSMDIPAAMELARKQRPEIIAAKLQIENDDTSLQIANNSLKPSVNINGFYSSNGLSSGIGDALNQTGTFKFPSYGMGLSIQLPIRNRAASADMGSALINKKSDLYSLRQRNQQINQDVRNAVHQLEESKLAITAAATARDLAQKTLTAEQRKYELGAETIFFVLDAQNTLEQAEQSYVQALIGYQIAIAVLDSATGNILEHNKVMIEDSFK